jgi:NADP-dependent aldehyde dehydrogenase
LRTSAQDFLQKPTLHEEIFGPVSLLVVCKNAQELRAVVASLAGQLTATLHAAESELTNYAELVEQLSLKVGRLVVNGFPTGVEVCPAMTHGGPFPASTDVRFTSVGTAAIKRFLRPLCYQNYPHALLPDALKNSNPYQLTRTVNGKQTSEAIE